MIDKTALGIVPEQPRNANYESAKRTEAPRGDLPDFDKLMQESSAMVAAEREKEKAAAGGNEIRLGETKSDADFREKLEKITGKKQDKAKNKMDKDDYLNLMVTQMKMQDPTKPMDNQAMAEQLAQFNSVEQLLGINKQLQQLNTAQNSMRGEKLTQYLGMNIQVAGSNLKVAADKVANEGFFELPTKAGTCVVDIKDTGGTVVRSLKLGSVADGQHKVEWDGLDDKGKKVGPGVYTFSVNAASLEGKPITTKTSITARVDGITSLADGGKLDTTAGELDPKNVIAVRAASNPTPSQVGASAIPEPAMNANQPQPPTAQQQTASAPQQPVNAPQQTASASQQASTPSRTPPAASPAAETRPAAPIASSEAKPAAVAAKPRQESEKPTATTRSTKGNPSQKGDQVSMS